MEKIARKHAAFSSKKALKYRGKAWQQNGFPVSASSTSTSGFEAFIAFAALAFALLFGRKSSRGREGGRGVKGGKNSKNKRNQPFSKKKSPHRGSSARKSLLFTNALALHPPQISRCLHIEQRPFTALRLNAERISDFKILRRLSSRTFPTLISSKGHGTTFPLGLIESMLIPALHPGVSFQKKSGTKAPSDAFLRKITQYWHACVVQISIPRLLTCLSLIHI